jgi:hypothetical protein
MGGWRVDIDRGSVDKAVDDGRGLWKTSRELWITANEGCPERDGLPRMVGKVAAA